MRRNNAMNLLDWLYWELRGHPDWNEVFEEIQTSQKQHAALVEEHERLVARNAALVEAARKVVDVYDREGPNCNSYIGDAANDLRAELEKQGA